MEFKLRAASGDADVLRERVYSTSVPRLWPVTSSTGQKLVIRQLAEQNGTKLTPVRECLRRLVAEGVLEREANPSMRVPRMTSAKVRELRDIQLTAEGIAAARSAETISLEELAGLSDLASQLADAKRCDGVEVDVALVSAFQLGVCRASGAPQLQSIHREFLVSDRSLSHSLIWWRPQLHSGLVVSALCTRLHKHWIHLGTRQRCASNSASLCLAVNPDFDANHFRRGMTRQVTMASTFTRAHQQDDSTAAAASLTRCSASAEANSVGVDKAPSVPELTI